MKLVSLNMEGEKHWNLIKPFLKKENPSVLCLQEAPESFKDYLQTQGYYVTFAPRLKRLRERRDYVEGLMFASKFSYTSTTEYCNRSAETIIVPTPRDPSTGAHALITATVTIEGETFVIATTHGMITSDGLASSFQTKGFQTLLSLLKNKEAHILCGDFNMPRGYNSNYNKFTELYTDNIPTTYKSSLDRSLHAAGHKSNKELNAPIFDEYMVDYVFSQTPYVISDVRLEFGVSDHAAIIATITKEM